MSAIGAGRGVALALLLTLLVGCGSAAPATSSSRAEPAASPAAARGPKVIVVAVTAPLTSFGNGGGLWSTGSAGGLYGFSDVHTSPLFTTDPQGNLEGRLVSRLPTLEDGTMVLLPDGRMQTTWSLRPGVKWHDGAAFTAADLVFTLQVYRDREVGLVGSPVLAAIEAIEPLDAGAVLVTWKSTYFQPHRISLHQFWPLPQHLLGAALQGDKTTFRNLPYWTSEYVNSGPFRLADYGIGEEVVFERFDDYYLGAPKVDRVVFRVIRDSNAVLANLQANAVDIASQGSLPGEAGLTLDAEWKRSGAGHVVTSPGSFRFWSTQLDPELARPPELRDVRIREGLLLAVDREAFREAVLPGAPNTSADSFLPDSDPRTPLVGKPFARYAYNPTLAAQRLEAGGWRRAADGRCSTRPVSRWR